MKLTHETLIRVNPAQILLPRFTVSQIMRNDQQVSFRIFFTANHQTFDKNDYIVVKYAKVDKSGMPKSNGRGGIEFYKPLDPPPKWPRNGDQIVFGKLQKDKKGAYVIDWGQTDVSTVETDASIVPEAPAVRARRTTFRATTAEQRVARSLTPSEASLAESTLANVGIGGFSDKEVQTALPHLAMVRCEPASYIPLATPRTPEVHSAVTEASAAMGIRTPSARAEEELEQKNNDTTDRRIHESVSRPPDTPVPTRFQTQDQPTSEIPQLKYNTTVDGQTVAVNDDGEITRVNTLILPSVSQQSYLQDTSELEDSGTHESVDNYWRDNVIRKDYVRPLNQEEIDEEMDAASSALQHIRLELEEFPDSSKDDIASDPSEEDSSTVPTPPNNDPDYEPPSDSSRPSTEDSTVPESPYNPDSEPPADQNQPDLPSYDPDKTEEEDTKPGGVDQIVPDGSEGTGEGGTESDSDYVPPGGKPNKKPKSRLAVMFTVREGEDESLPEDTPDEYVPDTGEEDVPPGYIEDEEPPGGENQTPDVRPPATNDPLPGIEFPDAPNLFPAYAYTHIQPYLCHFEPGFDTVTGDLVWKVGFGFAGSFDRFEDYVRFLTNAICKRVQDEITTRPGGNGKRIKVDNNEIIDATAMMAQRKLFFRSNPGYVYCYWGHSTPRMLRLFQAPYYFRNHHSVHLYWYLVCASASSTEIKDNTYRILIGRHGFVNRGEELVVLSHESIVIPGNSFFNPMSIEVRDENDELYELEQPYIVEWTFTPLHAA